MTLSVAIVGRPNVGKSTLFNRLVGRPAALVDDTPGVTRDWREGDGRLGDLDLNVIDTAGLEEAPGDHLEARMMVQTERALSRADVALLLVDARAGVTPLDSHFAKRLRETEMPIILAANKCEGRAAEAGLLEAYALGLGEPLALSAEHGEGMGELYDALAPYADAAIDPAAIERDDGENPLQMAVVGRPNVGKSTLINRLIGDERLLTGPEAGITRDAIAIDWRYQDRPLRLIDTAGLRRRAKVADRLETLSADDSHRAIQYAQIVVLMLDSRTMLEKQDLTIARQVADEGRVLIIAVNKWDIVKDKRQALNNLHDRLERSLPQLRDIPVVTLSALTGRGLNRLLPTVLNSFDVWNKHVATGPLNRWLEGMTERHPPPVVRGSRLRLRYMTQAKSRPPTFVLFANRAQSLPDHYQRYLVNGLRDAFDLPGIPIRLHLRRGKNPYAPD